MKLQETSGRRAHARLFNLDMCHKLMMEKYSNEQMDICEATPKTEYNERDGFHARPGFFEAITPLERTTFNTEGYCRPQPLKLINPSIGASEEETKDIDYRDSTLWRMRLLLDSIYLCRRKLRQSAPGEKDKFKRELRRLLVEYKTYFIEKIPKEWLADLNVKL